MQTHRALSRVIAIVSALCAPAAGALEVTLDSGGSGSVMLSDVDLDGIIDFDETVGGVFRAKGRVLESIGPITTVVTLTATPPDTDGIFGKIGVGAGTAAFTVSVTTTGFPATGPPLGWTVAYVGDAVDSMGGIIDIPSHSVDVSVNAGTVPLTTLTGSPISVSSATSIDLQASGVNPADVATDVTVVFSFTPGPDDQILLADNNGFDNKSIEVNVFNQSESCIDRMNNGARRVALLAGNSDAKCVKKGKGTDATICVDDPLEPKTDKKEQKLLTDFADRCAPVPAWGVNGATCCEGGANDGMICVGPPSCPGGSCVGGACISAAAETGAGAITHDAFGATVVVSGDKKAAACQAKVLQRAEKLYAAHWKAFRKCKKDNFGVILNDADLVSVCLGPPQTDAKGSISKALTKLGEKVQSTCLNKGITPVGAQFPGLCTGTADGMFAACITDRVACRFCQAANRADAIVPPLDCDAFDGGSAGSCTP
jgi:hypothetical protein